MHLVRGVGRHVAQSREAGTPCIEAMATPVRCPQHFVRRRISLGGPSCTIQLFYVPVEHD